VVTKLSCKCDAKTAGFFFSAIHSELISKGRLSALKLLIRSFSREKYKFSYFMKTLLILIAGPVIWDRGRRVRGIVFWKAKRL